MEFKFEKLVIWQKAMEMGESVNILSHKFPKSEVYNLSSHPKNCRFNSIKYLRRFNWSI